MENLSKEQQARLDYLEEASKRLLQVSQLTADVLKKLENIFGREYIINTFSDEDTLEKILYEIESPMPGKDDTKRQEAIQTVKDAIQQAEKIIDGYKFVTSWPMTVEEFLVCYRWYGDTRDYLVEADNSSDFSMLHTRFSDNKHVHISYNPKTK